MHAFTYDTVINNLIERIPLPFFVINALFQALIVAQVVKKLSTYKEIRSFIVWPKEM